MYASVCAGVFVLSVCVCVCVVCVVCVACVVCVVCVVCVGQCPALNCVQK
jgi:hypothetical protein